MQQALRMIAARRDTKFSRNDGKLGWRDLCLRQWWGLWSCLRESDRLQGCNQMLYLEMTGQRKQSLYQERVGDARIAWHRCCQWQGGFAVWDSLKLGQTRPNSNSLPQVILTYRKCLSHLSVAWLPLVASQEDDAMICHGKVCNLMILDVSWCNVRNDA